MRESPENIPEQCHVEVAMGIVGGRWKLAIVKVLIDSDRRYNELLRRLPGITPRMLSRQLRDLERDRIVARRVVDEVPPAVWYSLTPIGRGLDDIALRLEQWGRSYLRSSTAGGSGSR